MPEQYDPPLTNGMLSDFLTELQLVFPSKDRNYSAAETFEVYRNGLNDLRAPAVRYAVTMSIKEDSFFPKPARLRQLAAQYYQSKSGPGAHRPPARAPSQSYCEQCASAFVVTTRYRPALTSGSNSRIVDEDGRIKLEPFERVHCRCDAPSVWVPERADAPVDDLWTAIPRYRTDAAAVQPAPVHRKDGSLAPPFCRDPEVCNGSCHREFACND